MEYGDFLAQAWTETSSGTDASETEGDSELQQWKRETNDGASEGTDVESSSTEAEDDSRENGDEGSRDIFDHGTQNSQPANIWSDSSTGMPKRTGSGQQLYLSCG